MGEQIPGPRALPLLGNLLDVDLEMPTRGAERLADQYGPIYQMTVRGRRAIVCSSAALMEELTDEKRFVKVPPQAIAEGQGPKGLFSASNENPDWHQGHRILMPAFAPMSVQNMFAGMKDIANQLILNWARKGSENVINAPEDFTKLTLDTIALCTMDYRFNSFYTNEMHPFVDAMVKVLVEDGSRASRPKFLTKAMVRADREHQERKRYMHQVGMDIVEHRRQNPKEGNDVLNTMIYGKDPKTGEVMRDELISAQMLTFLIAGHETTSGLLSFAFAEMLRHPETYFKAQEEVDRVVGKRTVEYTDIKDFHYLNAVLRETMRLRPTVPALTKAIHPDRRNDIVTLDGYVLQPTDRFVLLLSKAQRDPRVWGDDADQFKPDRMLDENFEKIMEQYPGSWKPFGNGRRACIGRPFAWQEALLVTAMVLQSFDVKLDDPSYDVPIKQTLTVKPENFKIKVTPRHGLTATDIDRFIHTGKQISGTAQQKNGHDPASTDAASKRPMTILYGSNTGTCQALAQRAASDAASRGFTATISDMDNAVAKLRPENGPVVVFTSSYEGEPPDNAAKFMSWLQTCSASSLSGIEFAVFGCGHRDWVRTLHRVPKLADASLEGAGAKRIAAAGFTDVAKGNVYGDFEDWLDSTLWPALKMTGGNEESSVPGLDFELSTDARATALRFDVQPATVNANIRLTSGNEPEKFHLEIALPSNSEYECGDYLAVLPQNSEAAVKEAMALFNLPWDSIITLKGDGPSFIPLNTPTPVFEILRSYVELSQPVTKKTIRLLASHTDNEKLHAHLLDLANDEKSYNANIAAKRISLLHLYGSHQSSLSLSIGMFLSLLPPLQVRQYSISSSPLAAPGVCTLTYGVLDTASLSDPGMRFQGVTSNYLRSLQKGDQIHVSVRAAAKKSFRLPLDLQNTPMLMFAAGTGLAPFRGFCQQRAIQAEAGRRLAPAVLFLGCRSSAADRLYAADMDKWAKAGVVDVRYAFSKEPEKSEGCRHVDERMVKDAVDVRKLWQRGAKVYLCGSRVFAASVRDAAGQIAKAAMEVEAESIDGAAKREELEARFRELMVERVASDVFD